MGENADIVMEFLKDGPKTSNELSLMMFERKYNLKDKDTCDEQRKIIWGKRKVGVGLSNLQKFGLVDFKYGERGYTQMKTWFLVER